jgi:DNA-binding IclR family transcriptional regulator
MHERATHGLSAIAAGVYAPTGDLIAVISICALTSRMQKDRLPLLVECLKRHCAAAAIADLVD